MQTSNAPLDFSNGFIELSDEQIRLNAFASKKSVRKEQKRLQDEIKNLINLISQTSDNSPEKVQYEAKITHNEDKILRFEELAGFYNSLTKDYAVKSRL